MATRTQPCTKCGGSGWKPATEDTRSTGVVRCDCIAAARAGDLVTRARIPARYEHCALSDFDTAFPGADSSLAKARLAAGRFVEEYPVESHGLLIIGPIGVGKTHLAVGILKALIEQKSSSCLFCDYRELLKEIQNSYNASVQATELQVLRPIFDAEVLVLDELGAVRPSEWVWDTVSHILNTRYNHKRTTIITTNYRNAPPAAGEIDRFKLAAREETLGDRIGERMRSRLHEMCRIVEMNGADFRLKVQSANFR